MDLYHLTTSEAATSILREGFRDSTGNYLTTKEFSGVWLCDSADAVYQMGRGGGTLLKVSLRILEADLAEYEWVEENKGYREWLVPADLINANSSVEVLK